MAQDADELRARIDRQRSEISGTVAQIENRIIPGRIVARRSYRIRRRLTDSRDSVFGNEEPDYPVRRNPYAGPMYPGGARMGTATDDSHGHDGDGRVGGSDGGPGPRDRAGDTATSVVDSAKHSMHEAPETMRRQTTGNPLAAGAIALGAGWLIGSIMPKTEREQEAFRRAEPTLAHAASAAKEEGQDLASEMKQPARDAVEHVEHSGEDAATGLREESKQAAGSVRSSAGGSAGGSGRQPGSTGSS